MAEGLVLTLLVVVRMVVFLEVFNYYDLGHLPSGVQIVYKSDFMAFGGFIHDFCAKGIESLSFLVFHTQTISGETGIENLACRLMAQPHAAETVIRFSLFCGIFRIAESLMREGPPVLERLAG